MSKGRLSWHFTRDVVLIYDINAAKGWCGDRVFVMAPLVNCHK